MSDDNTDLIDGDDEDIEDVEASLALLSPQRATAERIEAFLQEYVIDCNKARAYKKIWPDAGHNTANCNSTRLLARPNVRARYRQLYAQKYGDFKANAKRVLEELSALAFYDPDDYYTHDESGRRVAVDLRTLSHHQRAAITEISTKQDKEGNHYTTLKLADKGKNLERLGRHFKMFTDVLEVNEADELADRIKKRRQAMKMEREKENNADLI